LDEIGELPPALQVKFLRVVQEREFFPLGAGKPTNVDLRTATRGHVSRAAALAGRDWADVDKFLRRHALAPRAFKDETPMG